MWAALALLIGIGGVMAYQLQSKRADALLNLTPVVTATVLPKAQPPAPASAVPEPTPARIVEADTSAQPQSAPFEPIGVQPTTSSAPVAAAAPAQSPRTHQAIAAAKKADPVPVKKPRRTSDTAPTATRPRMADPDTDLLSALLRRSKASDPTPSSSAPAEGEADCKSGQRCKP